MAKWIINIFLYILEFYYFSMNQPKENEGKI